MNIITNNEAEASVAVRLLRAIRDPEIGLNIIDLGLLYQLDFDDSNKVIYISMTLTTRFCPMSSIITESVKDVLQRAYAGFRIDLDIVFEPPWDETRISKDGKLYLNTGVEKTRKR